VRKKKKAYSAIIGLQDVAKTIADQMMETNRLAQSTIQVMLQTNMIRAATTLGDRGFSGNRDFLQGIMGTNAPARIDNQNDSESDDE
jgi:hypothetical protein